MNLVLSGITDDFDETEFIDAARPARVISISSHAVRLEECMDDPAARREMADLSHGRRIDYAYVDPAFSFARIKLLAMDMDSTLITIECIDEIADFIGKKKEVAAITEATMRGDIPDFAESLRRRVRLLAGTPASVLEAVFDERLRLSPGAEDLLARARAHAVSTLVVSGGFTYFTERLREELGLGAAHANVLEIAGGELTGRVLGRIVDAGEKARFVRQAMNDAGCEPAEAIVVGDGANDIPMMGEVVHSVAYRAKPATVAVARYAIRFGTLSTVLDFLA